MHPQTYSSYQASILDAIWRHSPTAVTRHRFHDIALQEVPMGNGAYALRALVAADEAAGLTPVRLPPPQPS